MIDIDPRIGFDDAVTERLRPRDRLVALATTAPVDVAKQWLRIHARREPEAPVSTIVGGTDNNVGIHQQRRGTLNMYRRNIRAIDTEKQDRLLRCRVHI